MRTPVARSLPSLASSSFRGWGQAMQIAVSPFMDLLSGMTCQMICIQHTPLSTCRNRLKLLAVCWWLIPKQPKIYLPVVTFWRFGCFSINRQQLCFVSTTDEFIWEYLLILSVVLSLPGVCDVMVIWQWWGKWSLDIDDDITTYWLKFQHCIHVRRWALSLCLVNITCHIAHR